ncbi:putative craniofacial development protein 2-like [Apostichopus japonicus]|uniref:Putative craniofacial development protein 2-like n=1 Tax=Stichopus japonicus TaxID=307972 RepID=A0A2G8KPS8_STIJA|nr:putative craniofacial development protein 2-like [Apostichopus japonicus]
MMNNSPAFIPDRSPPGIKRTASSVMHQGGGEKFTTGGTLPHRIRGRERITFATWNVRTLAQTGKLQELTHEMERYTWHIMGLCEVRWKNSGVHLTDEGHVLYYSGEPDKRINGVGFLVNKKSKNSVMGYCPTSSRLITIRLRATPFNITVIQAYAPTTDYDDDRVEEFYNQLQDIIDGVDKKDILIIQGDWNAKVGIDVWRDWKKFWDPPVMLIPMSEVFACLNSPATMTWCSQIPLESTRHPNAILGMLQMESTTTKLTIPCAKPVPIRHQDSCNQDFPRG